MFRCICACICNLWFSEGCTCVCLSGACHGPGPGVGGQPGQPGAGGEATAAQDPAGGGGETAGGGEGPRQAG